ncbi:hypothetical protein DASC09_023210 [Saccharomycopsis crataegensis]|uniref:DH domain-containing protein n=1 Tax=Saccharomycopsis crataegensis TaxID=43959 RepID=A0AAV5QK42_9ASCO|nr:hypothetical protein DASC09_023210 [Saccharomycopsis crataegensis]
MMASQSYGHSMTSVSSSKYSDYSKPTRPSFLDNIVICLTPTYKKLNLSPTTPSNVVVMYEDGHHITTAEDDKYCPTWLKNDNWRNEIYNEYFENSGSEKYGEKHHYFPNWEDVNDKRDLVYDGAKKRPRSLKLEDSRFTAPNLILNSMIYYKNFQSKIKIPRSLVQSTVISSPTLKIEDHHQSSSFTSITKEFTTDPETVSEYTISNLNPYKTPFEEFKFQFPKFTDDYVGNNFKFTNNQIIEIKPEDCSSRNKKILSDDIQMIDENESFSEDENENPIEPVQQEALATPAKVIELKPVNISTIVKPKSIQSSEKKQHNDSKELPKTPPRIPGAFSVIYDTHHPTSSPSPEKSIFSHQDYRESMDIGSDPNLLTLYDRCLLELFDTELAYYNDLKIIVDVYYKGLDQDTYRYILSENDKNLLFGNVEDIADMCEGFMKSAVGEFKQLGGQVDWDQSVTLLSLVSKESSLNSFISEKFSANNLTSEKLKQLVTTMKTSEIDVGKLLLNYFTGARYRFSDNYAAFIKNSKARQKLLLDKLNISGGPMFGKWYHESTIISQTSGTSAWDLESLMIKPVQRLLKYKILIDQLISHTKKSPQLFNKEPIMNLERSRKIIEEITNDINSHRHSFKSPFNKIPKKINDTNNFSIPKYTHHQISKSISELSIKTFISKSSSQDEKNSEGIINEDGSTELKPKNKSRRAKNLSAFHIESSKLQNVPANRKTFVNLAIEFKYKYEKVKELQEDILNFMQQLDTLMKRNVLICEDFISVLAIEHLDPNKQRNYHEMVKLQNNHLKKVIIMMNNNILMKVLQCIRECDNVRRLINEDREKRINYHKYIQSNQRTNKSSRKHFKQKKLSEGLNDMESELLIIDSKSLYGDSNSVQAQRCITIENLMLEKLPIFNHFLEEFVQHLSASFLYIVSEKWCNDGKKVYSMGKYQR